jgi:YesN/AraC family two-component response regulator
MLRIMDIRMDQGMEWFEEISPSHTSAVLILMSYGKCVYWIDNEKVIAEKGDLLLIPPAATYYGKGIPTIVHEKFVITFEITDRVGCLPLLQRKRWLKSKTGLYEFMLERIRRSYSEWNDQEAYSAIRGQAIVLEALALWNRELDQSPVSSEILHHAERMKTYIQEHYRQKVTKEELGDCISKSPNYAATVFRRATGQTISEYVHAVRMKSAVYLLRDSLLTVSEISELLGYRDVSYFQRTFKRIYAKPPSAYMKERPNRS